MQFKSKLMTLALATALPMQAMALEPATDIKDAITGGKVSGMLRLRFEHVEQDNALKDADALTLRSLIGYETKPLNGFSVNVQAYGVSPIVKDYNDAKKGNPHADRRQYSVVADPEDYDLHQAYLQWANKGNTIKLGRQNMFLDNWRFIGDVRFRQNWAVFNGISYVNTMIPDTTITLAHFGQVKRVNLSLDSIKATILNASYNITPSTSVTGYGYWSELEEAPAASTKTFGLRLNGKEKIADGLSALFTAEYAKQDDFADAAKIDADYYLVSGGLGVGSWEFRINQEMLSGTDSSSTQPFQTTFGTNHLFQGWTDLFLSTPSTGIEDTFVTATGKVMGAVVKAEYHMIDADKKNAAGDDEYGTEFDLGVYYNFKPNIIGSVEYAKFNQEDSSLSKVDTEKVWVTGIYKF